MKHLLQALLLCLILCLSFNACQKTPGNPSGLTPEQQLIQAAKEAFDQQASSILRTPTGNPRIDAVKNPAWSSATVIQLHTGPAVVVPMHYIGNLDVTTTFGGAKLFSLNDLTNLLIYKDNQNIYHTEIITDFPDTSALKTRARTFTGILFVEDPSGNRLHQYKYSTNGSIQTLLINQGVTTHSADPTVASAGSTIPTTVITTCSEISGYNYSPDDPDGGVDWTESGGCSTFYIADQSLGGPSPSGSDYGQIPIPPAPALKEPIVTTGPNIIGNAQNYFNCFTNVGGTDHLYKVTLCVDQPIPGTRQAWGYADGASGTSATNNVFDVGHTFLIFSETYGGSTITRNVGFYPKTLADPYSPSDQGQLNDNEISEYDISLTITITNAQFFNMLNYVSQGNNPGYLYNINTNNCTTFALTALQAGSVNISSQTGVWLRGSGYDPGDLGEDIRSMPLASNMSRNTVDNPHPNTGTCY